MAVIDDTISNAFASSEYRSLTGLKIRPILRPRQLEDEVIGSGLSIAIEFPRDIKPALDRNAAEHGILRESERRAGREQSGRDERPSTTDRKRVFDLELN